MPSRSIAGAGSMPEARFGALHAHRFLLRVGLALSNVFAWIFVFQYFFIYSLTVSSALIATLLLYVISQVATIVLTPFAAAHLGSGVKRSIIYGALLAGAAYIYLGATLGGSFNGEPTGWGIAVFALLFGAYRAVYFVPYQLKAVTKDGDRSRMPMFYEIIIALMPAFAGATLVTLSFAPLRILFGSAAFMLLSILPLIPLKDVFEGFSWGYFRTFRELIARRHKKILASSVLHGVQGASLFLIWPIAVFLIVGSSYQILGMVVSITLFLVMFLRILYRKLARKMRLEDSVPTNVIFAASGWFFRIFAGTPVGFIVADTFSHITAPKRSHAFDVFTNEQAADHGSYIDEYTALKEIGLALGRIITCAIFGLLLIYFSVSIAFTAALILAAIASAISVTVDRSAAPSLL
ncbi:MAG TPA: hypothetical protein VJH69_01380 [Candidatus Paceibacterota bacterium]